MKWVDHNTKTDYEKRVERAEVRLLCAFHNMANAGDKAARDRYSQAQENLDRIKREQR